MRGHNETHRGNWGWAAIGAFVLAFDLTQEETLSHAAWRGLENPRSRPLVAAAIGVTALHLFHALPEQLDPFQLAFERLPHNAEK